MVQRGAHFKALVAMALGSRTGCGQVTFVQRHRAVTAAPRVPLLFSAQLESAGGRAAHQVPAVAEEGNEPVGEEVDEQLDGEEGGEEVVELRDEDVGGVVLVDLNVDDVGDKVLWVGGRGHVSCCTTPTHQGTCWQWCDIHPCGWHE
jgi:hypothetical protein